MEEKTRFEARIVVLPRLGDCASKLAIGMAFSLLGLHAPASAEPTYTSFDPPGSTRTQPYAINERGDIAGYYTDSNNVSHGFLRTVNGTITAFDPPVSTATYAIGINNQGVIVGDYFDSNDGLSHGYTRAPDGTITVIDAPQAVITEIYAINYKGTVGGFYEDGSYNQYGFLRLPNGKFEGFDDARGAIQTVVVGINESNMAGGYAQGSEGEFHGFVRAADRAITDFDGRVEDGRSGLGHTASPCFPSPLIKPDERISRIRLSDWFHCKAHVGNPVRQPQASQRSDHWKNVGFAAPAPSAAVRGSAGHVRRHNDQSTDRPGCACHS